VVWRAAVLSLMLSSSAFALGPSSAKGGSASPTSAGQGTLTSPVAQPVSVSYTQLTKCFPELKNEAWVRKVDLNELKEEIDSHFVTTQSLLRLREVWLRTPQTEVQKRLRLAARPSSQKGPEKFDYVLTLEKLDSKGGGTNIEIPAAHRVNPTQKDLNSYFINEEVTRDESSFYETKLRGLTLSYKKNFKTVSEIELKDPKGARRVFCDDQKDLGIVCTCFSK
jgi:hypothetical protein